MPSILLVFIVHYLLFDPVLMVEVLEDSSTSKETGYVTSDRKVFEMKFLVPRGGRYCLSHAMHEDETLDFNFAVVQTIPGKNLSVAFTLMDEVNSNIIISVEGRTAVDVAEVVGGEGGFEMCFFNDYDLINERLVIFYMNSYKKHNWDNTEAELSELDVVAANFKDRFDKTQDHIEQAVKHLLVLRMKESSDLILLESILSTINFWSATYCFLIALVYVFQVYFVRILFDKNGSSCIYLPQCSGFAKKKQGIF